VSTSLVGEAAAVDTVTTAATTFWTDLAMGAWSVGHAAHEIATQLGVDLAGPDDGADANIINRNVDREARGDGTLIASFDAARRIAAAMPKDGSIIVVRPRFGLPLRTDNRALLRYLVQLGIDVRCTPRAGTPHDATDLPELVRAHPGLIGTDPNSRWTFSCRSGSTRRQSAPKIDADRSTCGIRGRGCPAVRLLPVSWFALGRGVTATGGGRASDGAARR
jgi:hypothetical protein